MKIRSFFNFKGYYKVTDDVIKIKRLYLRTLKKRCIV